MRLERALTRCWQGHCPGPWSRQFWRALIPLSWLFRLVVLARRHAYRRGWLRSTRLPVPVIVVGNPTVGGAGKTPLTLTLVDWLRAEGFRPGVISRGHGGRARRPMPVLATSDPAMVGDEPVLLARRAGCPVWIGRARAEAGAALLARHPEVNVIVADDGLQHLALARDLEIAVVDGARGFGNGRMLPAGPLREPPDRLDTVDAVVVNGPMPALSTSTPVFAMRLAPAGFVNVVDPDRHADAESFRGMPARAIAGIGHPERFFGTLAALGIEVTPMAFGDHHAYRRGDLPAGTVLMTEKDAVKCAAFARGDLWYLRVDGLVDAGLKELLINKLKDGHGSEAA